MLLSMTGYGEARHIENDVAYSVEIRTINNRYFKITLRSPDGLASVEPRIDTAIRKHVSRGTVHVSIKRNSKPTADDFVINDDVLVGYYKHLEKTADHLHLPESLSLGALVNLPGVVSEQGDTERSVEDEWPLMEKALTEAINQLTEMRRQEGAAMARDLSENCNLIAQHLDEIATRAPLVIESYQQRLTERLNRLLEEYEISIEPGDIVRELGLFTDRSDISEEIVRLRSHLDQFAATMNAKESSGRKLDFLSQEMFRETNTIGSKANDAEIGHRVIEIKAAIERLREMIQNVE